MEEVIFVTPQLKTGGGNRVFIEIANLMAKHNGITILYPNNSKETHTFILNEKIKLKCIGKYADNQIKKIFNLIKIIIWLRKNSKNKIVIISDPIMSILGWSLNRINVYRFIQADDYAIFDDGLVLKNKLIIKFYKILTKISYKNSRIKYIFNSKYVFEKYLAISKNRKIEYKLVHPGINQEIFKKNFKRNQELNISIIARKHPWKGFSDFVSVWNNLDEKYKGKIDNVYVISHDDLSGFELKDKKIKKITPKSDYEIAEIFNKSEIFISTSWWEGFGLPPLEAMGCGVAVLMTDSGGGAEYSKNNINCLVYEPKNKCELEKKLKQLIDDIGLRKKLSEEGMKTALNFSWEKSEKQFLSCIKNERG